MNLQDSVPFFIFSFILALLIFLAVGSGPMAEAFRVSNKLTGRACPSLDIIDHKGHGKTIKE